MSQQAGVAARNSYQHNYLLTLRERKGTDMLEHLLCARPCTEHLTATVPDDPLASPVMWALSPSSPLDR